MSHRHVTADEEPRIRFGLYRLCECPDCEGRGKVRVFGTSVEDDWEGAKLGAVEKCPECRGEGRIRQCVVECETPEAVGVALVTCAREGEWTNADGDPCAFGLLDRMPDCWECGGDGLDRTDANIIVCAECKGSGVKPTGTWLVLPWLPSPRNVSDAGRVLARSKKPADRG